MASRKGGCTAPIVYGPPVVVVAAFLFFALTVLIYFFVSVFLFWSVCLFCFIFFFFLCSFFVHSPRVGGMPTEFLPCLADTGRIYFFLRAVAQASMTGGC